MKNAFVTTDEEEVRNQLIQDIPVGGLEFIKGDLLLWNLISL